MPVDELVDVPERGRRTQKFGLSVTIPGPTASMATTSAPMTTRSKASIRVEGVEMPGDGDGDGCVILLYVISSICLNGRSIGRSIY